MTAAPTCADSELKELTAQARENDRRTAETVGILAGKLEATSSAEGDVAFADFISTTQAVLHLDDLEMSKALKVSRPTIGRWARGVSCPHPLARAAILREMAQRARARARELFG